MTLDRPIPSELEVLRYDYEVMPEPKGTVSRIWRFRSRKLQLVEVMAHVRVESGHETLATLEPKATTVAPVWPTGGVFVPKGAALSLDVTPRDRYEPTGAAAEILLDAQRIDGTAPNALCRFVTRWGSLGVGIPGDETFSYDGVELTGQALAELRRWLEAQQALKRGVKTPTTWESLADALSGHLTSVVLAGLAVPKGSPRALAAVVRPARLLDVLWLEVWHQATGARRLRRCPECRVIFAPGRQNQRFCTHLCANRPTVRRAKRKQRLAARRARAAGNPPATIGKTRCVPGLSNS